jgi:poly-gamma-glutamate synthesis protein (capsule biosynthesis protein)
MGVPTGELDRQVSLFLAGDVLITRPWSDEDDPRFLELVAQIREADVAIANLETLFHEHRGYAQADSGGTYVASPPRVALDLAWAGFKMMTHANNHAFDYGSIGVLENLANVRKAGLALAGSGEDLQRARSAAWHRHPRGTVALVAAASTFVPFGLASRSRPDSRGRPGVNPLRLERGPRVSVTRSTATALGRLSRAAGFSGLRFALNRFWVGPVQFRVGGTHGVFLRSRLDERDLEGNLAAIRGAAAADLVVASVHDHRQGRCLREFAHRAIEAGAAVVLVHGPHEVRGVELRHGKPIFYCLGNFAFEPAYVERLPSDYYEKYGLADDATANNLGSVRAHLEARRETWEGVAARLRFVGGVLSELRLVPVDLGLGKPAGARGRPRLADPEQGRRIIERVARRSRRYGTEISYSRDENVGAVRLR